MEWRATQQRWGIIREHLGGVPNLPPTRTWVKREDGGALTYSTKEAATMEAKRREREERARPFYGTSRYYAVPLPEREASE
jgi:hypothetical protein